MKQKTRKSVAKKVKVSGSGKLLRRGTGQNHYNVRDTGVQTRKKRGVSPFFESDAKNIHKALPYA